MLSIPIAIGTGSPVLSTKYQVRKPNYVVGSTKYKAKVRSRKYEIQTDSKNTFISVDKM
jgi:hypothetical protein